MNEEKIKFSKLGKFSIPCADIEAPVPEILDALNKHGITLLFIDKVFERVKEEAERSTVVFSPTAFWRYGDEYLKKRQECDSALLGDEETPEQKKARKLERIASEICEILAREKILAYDVPVLYDVLRKKIHRLSVVSQINKKDL